MVPGGWAVAIAARAAAVAFWCVVAAAAADDWEKIFVASTNCADLAIRVIAAAAENAAPVGAAVAADAADSFFDGLVGAECTRCCVAHTLETAAGAAAAAFDAAMAVRTDRSCTHRNSQMCRPADAAAAEDHCCACGVAADGRPDRTAYY